MPGGVVARRTLDERGLPTSRNVMRGQELLDRTEYEWLGLDRLAAKNSTTWGALGYEHDSRGRLASARQTDGAMQWRSPGPTGNLFKKQDRSDRRYGTGGVLLQDGDTAYAYDAAGRVISKQLPDGQQWKYEWDAAGHLTAVATPARGVVSFTYDALGRRISKTSDGRTTHWLWDGDVPVHEWSGDPLAPQLSTWIFEPESFAPMGKLGADGTSYSIVTDYLGTPTEMFDEAGKVAWKAQLDIYGVPQIAEGTTADCPWRWPGQYEDVETGLFYSRQRYYDPERGDFLSQDPISLLGHGPGRTLYGYTKDPLTWIDPFGLGWKLVDFANSSDLFPAGPGQSSIVTIVMQGARKNDFTQANIAGGFTAGRPADYTWHHVGDFNPATGECTMQLVTTTAHEATYPHTGSCAQFGEHFGVKYDTAESRRAAEEEGWKKKGGCG